MDIFRKITVSAIVPVFNEEKTVAHVIETILQSPLVSEVLVVNDGSTDKTAPTVRAFGKRIRFINLRKNHGKGFALAEGIKNARGQIVTFWDADLAKLNLKHLERILSPLLKGEAKATIGCDKTPGLSEIFKSLSGQRAYFRADLAPHLKELSQSGFGVEIYLNGLYQDKKVLWVTLKNLGHVLKHQKGTPQESLRGYLREGWEIALILAKREVQVFPEDWKILKRAVKIKNWFDFKRVLAKVQNPRIRRILNDYIFKYLR